MASFPGGGRSPPIAAWLAGRWGVVTATFQPYKLENKEILSLSDPKLSP